jgi:hypothetical protein
MKREIHLLAVLEWLNTKSATNRHLGRG